ncbi:hypothetical protein Y032_0266g698 [Ancylostoma ceylanicum]|uniref:rRNA methyltransferase 1, mitochondrial n=1 Tax=Ancylostoma ceylanicum TaxID=53326 RepID=A0A016S986_9BILA|nr:hypothetical protein Y032_0266g698 [Ancylostoma ceylanicum]
MTTLPILRPTTLSRRTLSGTVDGSTASDRPNLIYRKAKITGKSLEELRSLNVPVPKFRGEAVFGVYPVLEALATGARDFFGLYVKDTVRARSSHDERISKILEHARMLGLPVRRLTHSQFDKITDFQLHNGICLDASPLRFSYHLSDMQLTTVYLDNVLDPGNFGAIARSALFFGCEQIAYAEGRGCQENPIACFGEDSCPSGAVALRDFLGRGKATAIDAHSECSCRPSRITPAMSKASCGALECSRVVRVPSFLSFHKTLKSAGAVFVGTSDAVSARKFGKPTIELNELEVQSGQKLVVVLGDEGLGVSDEVMNNCDILLSISSSCAKQTSVNSLNVSVVAGILLHHIAAARKQPGK